jgi:hypothetical protein
MKCASSGVWRTEDNFELIQRPDRPIGVVILSLLVELVTRIIPASSTASSIMRSTVQVEDKISLIGLCVSIAPHSSSLRLSTGLFWGSYPAHLAALALIALNIL